MRHLEIETFSIAPVGHNNVCHGGKHAIARRLVANRRSADTRDGGALVARRRRHSSLCAHTVIIPRIGTNTCGWAASGLSETESLIPEREAKGPGARVLSASTRRKTLPAQTVMVWVQTVDFKLPARSHARSDPPALAAKIFAAPAPAFATQGQATKFRLIGVALFLFLDAARGDPDDLLDERTFARRRGQTCARSSSRPMRPRSVRAALNTDSEK